MMVRRKLPARTPSWTGLGFGSLPYESSLGALWRFAWFNALSGREIARLALIQGGTPLSFAGSSLHSDQFQRLTVATGISFPLPDESRVIARRGSLARILRTRIWLCPLCAQGNYHSFWFQLPFLGTCPVHNIPLVDTCWSCGEPTPAYAFSAQLSGGAWHCPCCRQPLAGAEPALPDFLDLWRNAKFLATVFATFEQWGRRIAIRGAVLDCSTESQLDSWRIDYHSLLLQGAVSEVRHPLGPFCRSPALVTHCLTWCERIVPRQAKSVSTAPLDEPSLPAPASLPHPFNPVSEFPHRDYVQYFGDIKPFEPGDRKCRRPCSVLCYLAVLGGIRRWLITRHAIRYLHTDLNAGLQFDARDVVRVSGRDVCEIAYLLMRFVCEVYTVAPTVLSGLGRPTVVHRWDYANLDGSRTVRRASRAGYLAFYGTLVLVIGLKAADGLFDLGSIPGPAGLDRALSVSWATDYLQHAGVVLMPQVEDLLQSFPSVSPGISAMWAKMWTDLQPGVRRRS